MSVIDNLRFEKRGARGCSNSEYLLQRTTCCGEYCVEDAELSDLYLNPGDLSQAVSMLRDPSDPSPVVCPFCGAAEWELSKVESLREVPQQWRWACYDK